MKLLAWVFVVSLILESAHLFGKPIYQAGQKSTGSPSLLHGEISAGYVLSSNRLEYVTHEDSSSRLKGGNIRALWSPRPWISLGGEFEKLGNASLAPLIKEYKVNRWAGIIRINLSPNTNPRFYVIGGYGKSEHKLEYDTRGRFYSPVTQHWAYWMAGLGIETDLWKCVFVGLEGNWKFYQKEQLTALFQMASHTQTDVHLRLGLRF